MRSCTFCGFLGLTENAVFHFVNGIEDIQHPVVVSDNDNGGTLFAGDFPKELHHGPASLTVEGRSGFVCKN